MARGDTRIQCNPVIAAPNVVVMKFFNALKPEEMLTEELRKKLEDLAWMHGWSNGLAR